LEALTADDIANIQQLADSADDVNTAKRIFWWFWRFYPELLAQAQPEALLIPADNILPDCPLHSYSSTVSALAGTMFPESWESGQPHEHPYLFIFTFSPVQEFIKASRKFVDFWAGSYLLHYLGAKLCWHIAGEYGPDAVITPSLWSQEIIDALILQEFPSFQQSFEDYTGNPVTRFNDKESTSLSTAGFPNVITALVPGKAAAEALGKQLAEQLKQEWTEIGKKVREDIKKQVIAYLSDGERRQNLGEEIVSELPKGTDENPYWRDLEKWRQHGCWEWNKLWDAQLDNTWESYWAAVPLGNPDFEVAIDKDANGNFDTEWKEATEAIAPSRLEQPTPTSAEETVYKTLNVGTWWGNVQSRLGRLMQSVKNTRTWQISTAPGERSTLSGQFSAVHPNLLYNDRFREGGGVSAGTMRLFWRVMAEVYPGLFNGSEKLNAIELTKRMAWGYGGIAESLGINVNVGAGLADNSSGRQEDGEQNPPSESTDTGEIDYEQLIRFPNLSSIASARFAYDNPAKIGTYWNNLNRLMRKDLPEYARQFGSRTRGRPFQVPKTDDEINPSNRNGQDYNGAMFSSKWLAEDMGLQGEDVNTLRGLVDKAHRDSGFGDGSPGDWWAIVLADGDGMGKYVSGRKLKYYRDYIVLSEVHEESRNVPGLNELLDNTKKRMGPATHVGLNRALLDFSNRLVPYITEHRFCGKVVYSGGDDVMAVLPLADLPEYLLSLRAAWCGGEDPQGEFESRGGYWHPKTNLPGLPKRPHFTMGEGATMSMGIVIAYKSVPLPTVLENLWTAEKERAKKIPGKDGLCFRVIYGGGNVLEAVMKGELLESWYSWLKTPQEELSPLLYRLAEELPRRATVTDDSQLFALAAKLIIASRDESRQLNNSAEIEDWLKAWENWVNKVNVDKALGTQPEDLGKLLRFSAFWVDKMVQQKKWVGE
jgi:CRISPR-associated protein Cmr2